MCGYLEHAAHEWPFVHRRTFKLDVLQCACGGRREVIALIPSGEIATKILAHLRLPVTAESLLTIRAPPWTQDYGWLAANDEVDLPFPSRLRAYFEDDGAQTRLRALVGGRVDWRMPAAGGEICLKWPKPRGALRLDAATGGGAMRTKR